MVLLTLWFHKKRSKSFWLIWFVPLKTFQKNIDFNHTKKSLFKRNWKSNTCRKTGTSNTAFTSTMSRNWLRRKRWPLAWKSKTVNPCSDPSSAREMADDENGPSSLNDLDGVPSAWGHVGSEHESSYADMDYHVKGTPTLTTWRLSLTLLPLRRSVKVERAGPWGSPRSAGVEL